MDLTPPSPRALAGFVERGRLARRVRPPASEIVRPGPDQESVWDFPRPPRVEPVDAVVRVDFGGATIARSSNALRVVETAGAPCYYVPPPDCELAALRKTQRWTICEWKGLAYSYDIVVGEKMVRAGAWSYPEPLTDLGMGYERIAGYFAFYASKMDGCFIGDERVVPQTGGYYGGWVTAGLAGPIKGAPGSEDW